MSRAIIASHSFALTQRFKTVSAKNARVGLLCLRSRNYTSSETPIDTSKIIENARKDIKSDWMAPVLVYEDIKHRSLLKNSVSYNNSLSYNAKFISTLGFTSNRRSRTHRGGARFDSIVCESALIQSTRFASSIGRRVQEEIRLRQTNERPRNCFLLSQWKAK